MRREIFSNDIRPFMELWSLWNVFQGSMKKSIDISIFL